MSPDITVPSLVWLAGSYLLGAVPSSYLMARWMTGLDLREHGSRNLGATNLYRLAGWRGAVPAGLFDVVKGTVPVALAIRLGVGPAGWPLIAGAAAVLGHVYSPFVGFRGGKGVATAAGVFLALAPGPLGIAAAVWLGVVGASGYVSLGSMLGAAAFAVSVPLFHPGDRVLLAAAVTVCAFIVFTHRSNIRRLASGTESRFRRLGEGRR